MKSREYEQQVCLFRFLSLHERRYPMLRWVFAVPNGLFLSPRTAAKAKAQGVRSGVHDIFVPTVSFQATDGRFCAGLWLELKIKPNKLTQNQLDFKCHAEREGYKCVTCFDWVSAANEILDYLGIHDKVLRDQIRINEKANGVAA